MGQDGTGVGQEWDRVGHDGTGVGQEWDRSVTQWDKAGQSGTGVGYDGTGMGQWDRSGTG